MRSLASQQRWWVHVGLLVTVSISLVLEASLTIHIVLGFAFVALVVVHLAQRKRVSRNLVRQLIRRGVLQRRSGRLALSDALLVAMTVVMVGTGLLDVQLGHPTRIRWHALAGIALVLYLVLHTWWRRSRLRASRVS